MIRILKRGLNGLGTAYRERGPQGMSQWVRQHVYERACQIRSGVDTGVDGGETNCGDYVRYQPIPFAYLDTVFRLAGVRDGNKGVLDYGCGKGRVVVEAARYACTCVVGVDYDERLTRIAEGNVAKMSHRFRCSDVTIVKQDAMSFPVDDRIDVVIMNNPFTGNIMRGTLDRVRESFERSPRSIRLYYVASNAEPCLSQHSSWLKKDDNELPLGVGSGRLLRCYTIAEPKESQFGLSDNVHACMQANNS